MNVQRETSVLQSFSRHSLLRGRTRLLIGGVIMLGWFLIPLLQDATSVEYVQAAPLSSLNSCQPFTQVNDGAFGMDTGGNSNYNSEEGFEVLVFNDQLYLGMEADNIYGARIWRTKAGVTVPNSQADWEEVAADANGKPFGVDNVTQNDHIDSLAEFNGYLYASTANGGSSTYGTRIFRNPTGASGSWQDAIAAYGAGFGDINNTNFKDMQVFQGQLCGGTQNWMVGSQVWCTSDGTTWAQKNVSGFGTSYYNNRNVEVWSGYVYGGALYFGVQNLGARRSNTGDDVAKLYRTTDLNGSPTWAEVYSGAAGSRRVDILGELYGFLYVSVRSSADGIVILRSPNGDAGSWSQVNIPGMDGNPNNYSGVVDSATVYDGGLYVGVANTSTGFELWRTSGALQGGGPLVDWEQVDSSGLGDSDNYYTELITYNSYLYAWTSNYVSGQEVLQSECVSGGGEPAPTVTNTPLPTPTATNTPPPTPTATSPPTATPTDPPTPTPTDPPTPTATAIPPTPTPTDPPTPTAANAPPTPTATATESVIEETILVDQTDQNYIFSDAVGGAINFTDLGNVTELTVRASPNAWNLGGLNATSVHPDIRHYLISADGSGFEASLTLVYTDAEFVTSGVADENTTYLARWDGSEWDVCPESQIKRDITRNSVTCSGITEFSQWVIAAGDEPLPQMPTETESHEFKVFLPLAIQTLP